VARIGGQRLLFGLARHDGVAMVEFALVLPLLLMLALGVMDFGKAFNYWIDETHLSNEAARWAVVNSNPGSAQSPATNLQTYIKDQADSAQLRGSPGASVCISFPAGTSRVGDPVQVLVKYSYSWLGWFPSRIAGFSPTTTIQSAAVMRLEAVPTNYSTGDNIGSCT
jgi:Flp pilus assembly protein TadG